MAKNKSEQCIRISWAKRTGISLYSREVDFRLIRSGRLWTEYNCLRLSIMRISSPEAMKLVTIVVTLIISEYWTTADKVVGHRISY